MLGRNVRSFGAVGDGVANDTRAIQQTIDEGPGTVWLPPGTYRVGTLRLHSDLMLYLAAGATLLGSEDPADYPVQHPESDTTCGTRPRRALLYACDERNITVTGHGMIDGNGGAPAFATNIPNSVDRPYGLWFLGCRGITVSSVTMRNSGFWMQRYVECEDLAVRGINVYNHCNLNNDGLDIDDCKRVTVSDCVIDSSDDGICLKSTGVTGCEDVTVTNCVVSSLASAIRLGLMCVGGYRNICISNCVVRPSRAPELHHPYQLRGGLAGIDLDNPDRGIMENIRISNITMEGPEAPIVLRYANKPWPEARAKWLPSRPDEQTRTGRFRRVALQGITATDCGPVACSITGYPGGCIEQVSLRDIHIEMTRTHPRDIPALYRPWEESERATELHPVGFPTTDEEILSLDVPDEPRMDLARSFRTILPAYGFYVRHARDVCFDSVVLHTAESDIRPAMVLDDVRGGCIRHLDVRGGRHKGAPVRTRDSQVNADDELLRHS